jgi:hypothetical protein
MLNAFIKEDTKSVLFTLSKDNKTLDVIKDSYPFDRITFEIDANTCKNSQAKL